jgi:hypothetical protein
MPIFSAKRGSYDDWPLETTTHVSRVDSRAIGSSLFGSARSS